MSYLLDTNVLSELRKPQPDAHVRAWFASASGESLFLSVLTLEWTAGDDALLFARLDL